MFNDILLLVAATSITTIVLYTVCFIILMVGVYADSKETNFALKWFALFGLYFIYFIDNYSAISIKQSLHDIFSTHTLISVIKFLGIGIVYALIETALSINKSSKKFSDKVATFKESCRVAREKNRTYDTYLVSTNGFVEASFNIEDSEVTTKIVTSRLTDYLTAWTVLWPLYLINLLFGRILANFFGSFAGVVKKVIASYVNRVFSNRIGK